VEFISSPEQIQEITDVLQRPKFSKYFDRKNIIDFLFFFNFTCKIVKINEKVTGCRDYKDNFISDIAVNGGDVDYIMTGDKDLLELNPFRGVSIIKVKVFEKKLKQL